MSVIFVCGDVLWIEFQHMHVNCVCVFLFVHSECPTVCHLCVWFVFVRIEGQHV